MAQNAIHSLMVCVLVAQLVDHCVSNTNVMGLIPRAHSDVKCVDLMDFKSL